MSVTFQTVHRSSWSDKGCFIPGGMTTAQGVGPTWNGMNFPRERGVIRHTLSLLFTWDSPYLHYTAIQENSKYPENFLRSIGETVRQEMVAAGEFLTYQDASGTARLIPSTSSALLWFSKCNAPTLRRAPEGAFCGHLSFRIWLIKKDSLFLKQRLSFYYYDRSFRLSK